MRKCKRFLWMDVRGIRTRVKRCIVVEYEDEEIRNRRRVVRVGGRRGLEGNRKRGTYRSEGSPMEVGRAAVGRGLWMDGEHQCTRYEPSNYYPRPTSYVIPQPLVPLQYRVGTHPPTIPQRRHCPVSEPIYHPYAICGTGNGERGVRNRHSSLFILMLAIYT